MPLASNVSLAASSHCRRLCQNKKMIKRRFFKLDHGDRDASDPSSSSSESELEAEAEATEEESSEDDATVEAKPNVDEAGSTSSGYASEDSSANDVDVNSTDDAGAINEKDILFNKELLSKPDTEKSNVSAEKETLQDMPAYVLKHKSVFKCKICPRITCLSEGTLRDHLQSKRHARSVKLLSEGRLKAMLNSDGEIENQEIAEIPSKDTEDNAEKNHEGRKQHKKRFRKKKSGIAKTKKFISTEGPVKRRQKK